MSDAFSALLQLHLERYPLLEMQDLAKLCYQSEFGPEHMLPSEENALDNILRECTGIQGDACPKKAEIIGNNLCRFPLFGLSPEKATVLATLFCHTAAEHTGSREGLQRRLACAEALGLPGGGAWLEAYRSGGCPPLHHSDVFRQSYRPHYRVISTSYAVFFPVLLAMHVLAERPGCHVVAIDGCCGSGKTTLARMLEALYPCRVFHTDDYYLPTDKRPENWDHSPCGHMDLHRLEREILEPASRGEPVTYRAYDCQSGSLRPPKTIAQKKLTVIEGSYCLAPSLRRYYDNAFFLTCDVEEQHRRLSTREGDHFDQFLCRWIPLEELYRDACAPQSCCRAVIATDLLTDALAR